MKTRIAGRLGFNGAPYVAYELPTEKGKGGQGDTREKMKHVKNIRRNTKPSREQCTPKKKRKAWWKHHPKGEKNNPFYFNTTNATTVLFLRLGSNITI